MGIESSSHCFVMRRRLWFSVKVIGMKLDKFGVGWLKKEKDQKIRFGTDVLNFVIEKLKNELKSDKSEKELEGYMTPHGEYEFKVLLSVRGLKDDSRTKFISSMNTNSQVIKRRSYKINVQIKSPSIFMPKSTFSI